MNYQEFLTAFRGAGVTVKMADEAGRAFGLKRARNWTQATWITKVAEEAIRCETYARQQEEKAAAEAARKAKLEAEATRRGTLESFIERSKDMDEADRKLGWALRHFLRDEQAWAEAQEKFTKSLAQHPTYALQWSGSLFEAAATYEVAREVRTWFEAGVDVADMIDHLLKETLRGARNLGNGRSTSNTSNLVDDVKTAAFAKAYERLSERSIW